MNQSPLDPHPLLTCHLTSPHPTSTRCFTLASSLPSLPAEGPQLTEQRVDAAIAELQGRGQVAEMVEVISAFQVRFQGGGQRL